MKAYANDGKITEWCSSCGQPLDGAYAHLSDVQEWFYCLPCMKELVRRMELLAMPVEDAKMQLWAEMISDLTRGVVDEFMSDNLSGAEFAEKLGRIMDDATRLEDVEFPPKEWAINV